MIFKSNEYLDKNFFRNDHILTIVVPFFAECNLNCQFCYWNNNLQNISNINIENIITAPQFIYQEIEDTIQQYKISKLRFILFGGQLFMDQLPNNILNSYKLFFDSIHQLFKQIKNISFIIQSNGIYKKLDRIYQVLSYKNYDIYIKLSYDQHGRFNNAQQLQIFENSIKFFNKKNKLANLMNVLTKQNIIEILNGNNKAIELCKKYDILCSYEYYLPNNNYEELALSDDLIFQYNKYCIDNDLYVYDPVLWGLYDGALGLDRLMYCNCKFEFIADIKKKTLTHKCINFISNLSEYSFLQNDSIKIEQQSFHYTNFWHGIKKRKCLQCSYFNSCGLLCWSVFNHVSFGISECALKRTYQYIIKTGKDKKYLQWKTNEYSYEKYKKWFNK